jgi:hypothetical protein
MAACRVYPFFMATLIIVTASLFGCGGDVTTTDVQPPVVAPTAGTATITWAAPSTNEDGSPLTALAGFKVYYGTTPGVYTSVDVGPANSYQVIGLTKGTTYYFAVTAYDSSGNESDLSTIVSKVIA